MIEFGKEYFNKPYYFYLKDRGNTFSVYFSVSETLNESRQNDDEVVLLKESLTKVKNFIKNLFKKGYKFNSFFLEIKTTTTKNLIAQFRKVC